MILVAPDKFKGTFTAAEVAAALAAGVRDAGAEARELPVADGGEGTAASLAHALGGELRTAHAHDPLGRPIEAEFALLGDGRAAVDVAAASGLSLLGEDERDPWAASTAGTGELVLAAASAGATEVIVAAGGSATVDGGAGAVEALERAPRVPRLTVACDVRTPWERAAGVYGPQKGADQATVERLAERLDALAAAAPRDPRGIAMTGAAGGLSGALWAHFGAELVEGAGFVLDAIGFDADLDAASAVITGEGRLDGQTLEGKAVAAVAERARARGVPVDAVVAIDDLDADGRRALGLRLVAEARDRDELRTAGARLGAAR